MSPNERPRPEPADSDHSHLLVHRPAWGDDGPLDYTTADVLLLCVPFDVYTPMQDTGAESILDEAKGKEHQALGLVLDLTNSKYSKRTLDDTLGAQDAFEDRLTGRGNWDDPPPEGVTFLDDK